MIIISKTYRASDFTTIAHAALLPTIFTVYTARDTHTMLKQKWLLCNVNSLIITGYSNSLISTVLGQGNPLHCDVSRIIINWDMISNICMQYENLCELSACAVYVPLCCFRLIATAAHTILVMTTNSITSSNSSPVVMEEASMIVLLLVFSCDWTGDGVVLPELDLTKKSKWTHFCL